MDKLEKAERLRKYADITYEEAVEALDAADEDLLDAIILLEKQGKVKKPGQEAYSTDYKEQEEYINVPVKVAEQKEAAPSLGKGLAAVFRGVIRFIKHTSFKVTRRGSDVFVVPSWLIVLMLLFAWKVVIPVGLLALLFGFRYSFEGSEDTTKANSILSKAGDIAGDLKNGLQGSGRES